MANLKEHGLIVSCQAVKGEPLYGLHMMGHFARAAVLGGASGIRANYVDDINEITAQVDVPVIGIIKAVYPDSEIYITPTLKEVKALLTTKCSVIALDATNRTRPNGEKLEDLIKYIRENAPQVEIMADCSNYEEAKRALHPNLTHKLEGVALMLYVVLAFVGVVLGASFCQNVFYYHGDIGALFSSGTVFWMGETVAFDVFTAAVTLSIGMLSVLYPQDIDNLK